jgi:hypothetical protein
MTLDQILATINSSCTSVVNIKAFYVLVNFSNFGEIYDVCTDTVERGKGIMKEMFQVLLPKISNPLWLGVDLLNPSFNQVVRLYTGLGFGNPTLVKETKAGYVLPYYFVSFDYPPSPNEPVGDHALQVAILLKEIYNQSFCKVSVTLDMESVKFIHDSYLIGVDTEYSGVFTKTVYDKSVLLRLDTSTIMSGSSIDNTVPIPSAEYNFHTHPDVCYINVGCVLGWPSGLDMMYAISQYNLTIHFVFALEGIYSIQVTPSFRESYRGMNDICKIDIATIIKNIFGQYETMRDKDVVSDQVHSVMEYLKVSNSLTINSIISQLPQYETGIKSCITMLKDLGNFRLFIVSLTKYIDIVTQDDLVFHNIISTDLRDCNKVI